MHGLNPLQWLRWFVEFVQLWFLGIPWRDAPKAIPAIILSMILFTTGFIAFSGGAGWRNRLLNRQYNVSIDRDDFPTAEIVLRRQLEAEPDNVELIYRFALIRQHQSFEEEAKTLMRKLLAKRHLPAAKWLLKNQILEKKWTDFDQEQLNEAGQILELISRSEPKNLGIKRMYVEYLIFAKRLASAIPLLDELSEFDPPLGLHAASLSRQLGDTDAATVYATKTLEKIEEMLKDDPTNPYLVMSIARNQVFLERHSDAVRTLQRGISVAKNNTDRRLLQQGLGDAIVAYINFIEKSPTNTVQERLRVLRMLDAAVRIAPNNPRVITMVADYVLSNLNEKDAEIASVREALTNGSSPGIAHFIKGTSALMKKEFDDAELHLELAAEQMPLSGAILNNLAVSLAHKDPPEYERALEVAGAAIKNVPNPTPHFYETRGQILFRMGRFREAISDLERALAEPTLATKAHQMLADCYDKVGDQELAESHRKAASKATQEDNADGADEADSPGNTEPASAKEASDEPAPANSAE